MTVLVIYCLRETSFAQYPFGIPEIIASLLVGDRSSVDPQEYVPVDRYRDRLLYDPDPPFVIYTLRINEND